MIDNSDYFNKLSQRIVCLLQELFNSDPSAMDALVSHRPTCNEELANHPTVQVGCNKGRCTVGMLGIVNGLFYPDVTGRSPIQAVYENDELVGFRIDKEWPRTDKRIRATCQ